MPVSSLRRGARSTSPSSSCKDVPKPRQLDEWRSNGTPVGYEVPTSFNFAAVLAFNPWLEATARIVPDALRVNADVHQLGARYAFGTAVTRGSTIPPSLLKRDKVATGILFLTGHSVMFDLVVQRDAPLLNVTVWERLGAQSGSAQSGDGARGRAAKWPPAARRAVRGVLDRVATDRSAMAGDRASSGDDDGPVHLPNDVLVQHRIDTSDVDAATALRDARGRWWQPCRLPGVRMRIFDPNGLTTNAHWDEILHAVSVPSECILQGEVPSINFSDYGGGGRDAPVSKVADELLQRLGIDTPRLRRADPKLAVPGYCATMALMYLVWYLCCGSKRTCHFALVRYIDVDAVAASSRRAHVRFVTLLFCRYFSTWAFHVVAARMPRVLAAAKRKRLYDLLNAFVLLKDALVASSSTPDGGGRGEESEHFAYLRDVLASRTIRIARVRRVKNVVAYAPVDAKGNTTGEHVAFPLAPTDTSASASYSVVPSLSYLSTQRRDAAARRTTRARLHDATTTQVVYEAYVRSLVARGRRGDARARRETLADVRRLAQRDVSDTMESHLAHAERALLATGGTGGSSSSS